MSESIRTRLFRWAFNLWPCFRGTGARVVFIASDWSEVAEIRRLLQGQPKVDRTYTVELVDREGLVHAEVQKVIHISLHQSS